MALACRTRNCLLDRYDQGNSSLIETDGARPHVRRLRVTGNGTEGYLFLFQRGNWITYYARETVVGQRGAAAGDVDAVSLAGTARLTGGIARELKPNGCEVTLRNDGATQWSMITSHCFDGAGADLNERFHK